MTIALTELIDRLEDKIKICSSTNLQREAMGMIEAKAIATELLEKERELATNTLQDNGLREAAEEWNKYKSYLQEKYPTESGEEWRFTCEHHQRIDYILNSKGH